MEIVHVNYESNELVVNSIDQISNIFHNPVEKVITKKCVVNNDTENSRK